MRLGVIFANFASSRQLAELPIPAQSIPEASLDRPAPSLALAIGEVCRQTGLSARTVRYYEELGLLPGVRRREAGRRVYGADELERLRFITRLKTLGLSLQEIGDLNALYGIEGSTRAMLARLDQLLTRHLGGLDERIAELGALRDEIGKYRDHVGARVEALCDRGED